MAKVRGRANLGTGFGYAEVYAEGESYREAVDNLRYLYPDVIHIVEIHAPSTSSQPTSTSSREYDGESGGVFNDMWQENFGILSPRMLFVLIALAGGIFLFWKFFVAH